MTLAEPTVSIVLATLNGAAFLQAQLLSIRRQDLKAWHVIQSDDGSTDDTLAIARAVLDADQLKITNGPQLGFAQNFWNGLLHVPDGHYAAFCDQDDVWRPDKLSRTVERLSVFKDPALYSAGRYVTDLDLNITSTQHRTSPQCLSRLIWRNTVAGHSCVLNPDAVRILKQCVPPLGIPFHDWWAALILSSVGGRFIHDPTPVLYYRQHDANVLGAKGGRLRSVLNGTYIEWVRRNLAGLTMYHDNLTPSAQRTLRICHPLHTELNLGRK
jgi:glycosyltransferase involved in cell wall biosynthesis